MTDQLAIDAVASSVPAKNERKLTVNQQLALEYIAGRDGTTCDELGAFIHAHRDRRPHSVDVRCDWCAKTGRSLVTSKALAPLLTYRRNPGGHLYVLRAAGRRAAATAGEQVSHVTAGDPFKGL